MRLLLIALLSLQMVNGCEVSPQGLPDVVERVIPQVVAIHSFEFAPIDPEEGGCGAPRALEPAGHGSGVIVEASGIILTCWHVVKGADEIVVTIGEIDYVALVASKDEALDGACLVINPRGACFKAASIGLDKLRLGESVFALGNPLNLGISVSLGIVSAVDRHPKEGASWILTDCPINPGNSGGALYNLKGELVGITNAGYRGCDGLAYAIHIETLLPVINKAISGWSKKTPILPDF